MPRAADQRRLRGNEKGVEPLAPHSPTARRGLLPSVVVKLEVCRVCWLVGGTHISVDELANGVAMV
jgi:hypothetical protein